MLVYHPAFDIHHCAFRFLLLLDNLKPIKYQVEQMQILDFYLLFPHEISSIRLTSSLTSQKRHFAKMFNKYDSITDHYRLFLRLEPFQNQALASLASYGFISAEALQEGFIEKEPRAIPEPLLEALNRANQRFGKTIDFLTKNLVEFPMHGPNGLKARTDLFEYRYDPTHSDIDV